MKFMVSSNSVLAFLEFIGAVEESSIVITRFHYSILLYIEISNRLFGSCNHLWPYHKTFPIRNSCLNYSMLYVNFFIQLNPTLKVFTPPSFQSMINFLVRAIFI